MSWEDMYRITLPTSFACGNNCHDKDGKKIVFESRPNICPGCGEMVK